MIDFSDVPFIVLIGSRGRKFMSIAGATCRALLLFTLSVSFVFAQSQRGTITGTVLDRSGASIPGGKVVITAVATNTTSTTDAGDTGNFTVPNLAPGLYTIRVDRDGFKPAILTGIDVDAGSTIRADVTLEIGTSTTAIEVSAGAIQLSTENAKAQTVITDKLIQDLPTVVGGGLRSPFDLAILAPESKSFGDNNFQMGGGQAASYGVNLDGVSANTTRALSQSWVAVNTPSLDAITEFSVETNGFKAEYGQAGGGMINFVSKSGTNDIHGTLYEYARNEAFDARSFFQPRKQIYKQHDFGGTVGGPVWIPKIYNGKNKTFVFFSYEAFRNRNGASSDFRTVPNAEMYNGDFRNWVDNNGRQIPIYDPFSLANGERAQFPNNQIPTSRFDPQSVKALATYGQIRPNVTAAPGTFAYARSNYQIVGGSRTQPATKYSIKGDQFLRESDRVSFYFGKNGMFERPGPLGINTLPGNFSDFNDLDRQSRVYRATWDHNFSPTLLNQFRGGGNDWKENHNSIQELQGNWKDKFCIGNAPDCNYNLGRIRFDDAYTSWGADSNNGSENLIYSFADDLTWIKGKHNIKIGGMYQKGSYNGFGRQCVAGCANFGYLGTGKAGVTNFNDAGGNAFASFLLGWATNGQIDTVRYIGQQWPYFAGYIQDDWKFSSKLTFNFGLRWETTLPPVEEQDRWSDFSPTRPNPGADNRPGALIYAGTGPGREGSRSLAGSWFKGFGPRFGLAYSLNSKTVIRSNFARSFSQVTTTTGSTHQKGFTQTFSFGTNPAGLAPTFLLKDGLPPYPVPPFISPSFQNGADMPWWQGNEVTRLPEQLSWNLSIQRQLSNSMVLDVAYNAVAGTHLQAGLLNYNQVPIDVATRYTPAQLGLNFGNPAQRAEAEALGFRLPYANFVTNFGSRATVAQSLRPFPQYTEINTWDGNGDHSGHSSYHAAVIKLDKRYSQGMSFTTSYVFSKMFTDADSYWITDNPRAADHYNRRLEKSIGSYDVTHNFKLGITYELPFGQGKAMASKGVAAWVLGGWRISSIHLYSSGRPIGVSGGTGLNAFNGRGAAFITTYEGWRAPLKGDKFDPAVDRFFNASVFPNQNIRAIGNSTRLNAKVREFANLNENVSLAKLFKFGKERPTTIEIRGEAFNIFNRHRFGTGGTGINDPVNFGRVTNVINDPRRLQIGAKIYF